jgi:hypothetical protein
LELSGGIGNQLFQVSLGKCLESVAGAQVKFIFAPSGLREKQHQSSLSDFNFRNYIQVTNIESGTKWIWIRRLDRFLRNYSSIYRHISRLMFGVFIQKGIGYDDKILNLKNIKYIRGYFQSFVYPDTIKQHLIDGFEIVNPSERFLELSKVANHLKPIILHLRRGDFTKLSDTVGLLGDEYYFRAIQLLRERNPDSEIWVFSDDETAAVKLVYRLESRGITSFRNGFGLNDSESLKLMSMGSGIVIANSTFSWWAAYLGEYGKTVVAPCQWFKGMPTPKALMPNEWILIEPSWI